MQDLTQCPDCQGFVPAGFERCPNCDRGFSSGPLRRVAAAALSVVTGGAFAMTLMACYGGAPQAMGPMPEKPSTCREGAEAPPPGSPGADPNAKPCSEGPTNSIATGESEAPKPPPPGS